MHDGAGRAVEGHRRPLEPFWAAGNIPTPPRRRKRHRGPLEAIQAAAGETSKEGSGLLLPLPFVLLFLLCLCWPQLLRFVLWLVHVYQLFKYQRKRQAVVFTHSCCPLNPCAVLFSLLHFLLYYPADCIAQIYLLPYLRRYSYSVRS